jgi:uncharacterized membrane protein YphA (DoxX/SURF4 family)
MYAFNEFSSIGYLALRLVIAVIFIVHAWPKLKHPTGMASGMGWSIEKVRFIGLVELLGSVLIALGVFIQWGALALLIVMIGAIYYKIQKWKVPFTAQDKTGWEFDLLLLSALLYLLTNAY